MSIRSIVVYNIHQSFFGLQFCQGLLKGLLHYSLSIRHRIHRANICSLKSNLSKYYKKGLYCYHFYCLKNLYCFMEGNWFSSSALLSCIIKEMTSSIYWRSILALTDTNSHIRLLTPGMSRELTLSCGYCFHCKFPIIGN